MNRRRFWRSIFAGAAFIIACSLIVSGQELHLKTRTLTGSAQRVRVQPGAPRHHIVQFDHPPGVEDVDALMQAGLRVIALVPDNAVMVFGPGAPSVAGGRQWLGELDAGDKLSPELIPPSVADDDRNDASLVIVEFHADVEPDAEDAIAAEEELELLRPPSLLAKHVIARANPDQIRRLAAHDEVAYIFPADPDLLTGNDMMPCAGMLTLSGPIAQYTAIVHGWDLDPDHVARLSYVFGPLTPKVPDSTTRAEIVRALDEWSKYARVVFAPGTSPAGLRTLTIKFASGAHGDPYAFTGPSGPLAHTFYPVPVNSEPVAGDMHLNADEDWHAGGDIDIYTVALHEAGHAIGLGHTDKPGDVMYPYYRRGMQLSANDIKAAQTLYGTTGVAQPGSISVAPPLPAPPPSLRLTVDPVPPPSSVAQATLTGTIAGGTAPMAIQWQSDRGYSGNASQGGSGAWNAAGITLVTGSNAITLTAFDSAHQTITQTVVITRLQSVPVGGSAPVSISIASPATSVSTTSSATISLSGKSGGGTGITQVFWQTSGGASGSAAGVGPWLAANIPLLTGTNTVIVRATDSRGANAWAAAVVVRR